jgi:endonuclease/exonuclease/phosphatase family metal-dependent hydrolase
VANIRILTWNLWWRRGPWQERYEAIRHVLRKERPDVCGVQEIWVDPSENMVESLAEELDMHWAWVPSPEPGRWQGRIGDPTIIVGNAVLSRWPITRQNRLHLPIGNEPDEGRTVMFTLLDAPTCRIPFFTAHLNSDLGQSETRCEQVRAIARFVVAHPGEGFPPIVTGDFNAEPDSDEIRLLTGRTTTPAAPGPVLLDSWQYAVPQAPGLTWNRRNPFVAQTSAPSARIDYVFVGEPLASGAGQVRSVRLVGDVPVNDVWPSDHAGVLVELAS